MSSVGKLMRQAQRIQQQMEAAQAALAQKSVETSSGGGAVKVVVSGDGQVKSIRINPDAVNKDDVAFLEDLVLTAVN
ncbi:MAG: YbaB/EbfC family nucleoid-associated protein, partial [Verrucomicrobiota bacterium]